ncbi:MAG: 1,4-alpha-glucan-branching enzyme [Bacteroidales bacterium]|jgi:1,4-alpha-glucan branching enzyme|nr:1,4-alpha-glucan-branching enzyme [Bacteroidales bacterium]
MKDKFYHKDKFLQSYSHFFENITELAHEKEEILSQNKKEEFQKNINAHLFFGVHKNGDKYIFREWAPNATAIYLLCDANNWQKDENYRFMNIGNGNWQCEIPDKNISHKSLYKLLMEWQGGYGERVSAWSKRAVQDEDTKIFNSQIWIPQEPHSWKSPAPKWPQTPLIYETHVGMALEDGKVGSFQEFREHILPIIEKSGYNVIQLMAIQEHPYYGSFGYHVSSLFAVSSRFGTPEDLKELIDDAHGRGISVVMDIVHSHAVKNEIEGIAKYDGSEYQFFHQGERGEHPAWDSRCYDYGKTDVVSFLLSNVKFWIEEYKFDGFRFDGVTSMIFKDHGLGRNFLNYDDYFGDNIDTEALAYLQLMNKLVKQINPNVITIAEEMSGFPGLCVSAENGGIGFDYRMAMGIPDYWIDTIKNHSDQNWHVGDMFHRLTDKRDDEKVVSYAESHDQALVGDKTIIFRLLDADMYWHMNTQYRNLKIDRGIALHKMIRLATLSTAGNAYLNFMGNEFGHPEWIDFPREGNNWSYHYARRQWNLAFDENLRYKFLYHFDNKMIKLAKEFEIFSNKIEYKFDNPSDQVLGFARGKLFFAFNFSPDNSYQDYGFQVAEASKYKIVLNSDNKEFDGFARIDNSIDYQTVKTENAHQLRLYLPARTAIVLQKLND